MFKNLSTGGLGIAGVQSEIIELALSFGFRSIELDLVEFDQRTTARGFDYAIRLIKSAEIGLGFFRLPVAWNDTDKRYEDEMARLPARAELAARIGCARAIATVDPFSDERPYHENFEFHRRRIGEIGQVLGQHGVRLGLEFLAPAALRDERAFEFIHTFDELVKLAAAVGEENVGVVVDVWHRHVCGSPVSEFEALSADQIIAVNLADAPNDKPASELTEKDRLLPGSTGVIDSESIVRRLSEIGYKGPVTARPHRSTLPRLGRVDIVRSLGESLESIWIAVGLSKPRPTVTLPPVASDEEAEIEIDVDVVAVAADDDVEVDED
jgi:sugar phosphate isomerase/epimerase